MADLQAVQGLEAPFGFHGQRRGCSWPRLQVMMMCYGRTCSACCLLRSVMSQHERGQEEDVVEKGSGW